MALYECLISSGGGSGQLVETTLWSNPSPNSAMGGGTKTLSESIRNFDFIKITSKASPDINKYITAICPVEDFVTTSSGNSNVGMGLGQMQTSSGSLYTRTCTYVSDTSVSFTTGRRLNASGQETYPMIPQEVVGMKLE